MMPSLIRRAARAGRRAFKKDRVLITHPARTRIGEGACLDASARLTVLDPDHAPDICIGLGDSVYLGRQVEITAAGGGAVLVGPDTSLQDGSILYGDVRIGAHCLFGRQVFVASRGHNFRHRPAWLIRDQDAVVLANPPCAGTRTVIEDDCWVGQNVVVTPGVYVGRGAILGANSVVTRDVGPYEIHGGVPNRRIGTRLNFSPPSRISSLEDEHLPYFYRGFALSQAALAGSRERGVIDAHGDACLILAATKGGQVEIHGHLAGDALQLRVNGEERPADAGGDFVIRADVPSARDDRPAPLEGYTMVELAGAGSLSISAASVT